MRGGDQRRSEHKHALLLALTLVATASLFFATPLLGQDETTNPGKLVQNDPQAGDNFGSSVSISGDTAVVGASLKDDFGGFSVGAAYVFVRDPINRDVWTEVAKLTPRDARHGLQFGNSVAIDGDTIVVGAVGDDERGEFTGSAYIFKRDYGGPNAWGQVIKLRTSNAARGDVFGASVSISGDTVVVGAPQDQAPFPARAGFATVFQRNQLGMDAWGEVARLTASDGQGGGPFGSSGDRFGSSVAISGETVIVGAPSDDSQDQSGFVTRFEAGSAYIFVREGANPSTWIESTKLVSSAVSQNLLFGRSVSISGQTAVISAAVTGFVGATGVGGVIYVFTRDLQDKHVWSETATLRATDAALASVSISGDVVAAGAPDDDEKGGLDSGSGSAYVFRRDLGGSGAWGQLVKLTANDGARGDRLGTSVSISGATIVLGTSSFYGGGGKAYACLIDEVKTSTGACRRAIPVVNDLIMMSDLRTFCCGAGDEFTIVATFTNTSTRPIDGPFLEVISLANAVLQNADGVPGGLGATLTPDVGDGTLSPGESTTVTFVLRFQAAPFWIRVNVRGEPGP